MTRDFNITDSNWDPNFHYHSIHTKDFFTIANSLGLEFSSSSNPGLIRYANNLHNSNSVLDLVFMVPNNFGFGKHILYPKSQCKT